MGYTYPGASLRFFKPDRVDPFNPIAVELALERIVEIIM
jgi:hypothetical protein